MGNSNTVQHLENTTSSLNSYEDKITVLQRDLVKLTTEHNVLCKSHISLLEHYNNLVSKLDVCLFVLMVGALLYGGFKLVTIFRKRT